jgi:enamine deaminase RidA (YjgF/YER057c/UK114 family)
MQPLPEARDLSARILEVHAVVQAFESIRLDLIEAGARGGDIVDDTRWVSRAMDAYQGAVAEWQQTLYLLVAELGRAADVVRAVVDQMVLADLLQATYPGMAAAR